MVWLKDKDARIIISMIVMRDNIVIANYGRRRSGLSSAPLDMEHDNNVTG